MRIAFFTDTYHPSRNGVVTSTDSFRDELVAMGHGVHIFAPSAPHTDPAPGVTRVASMPFPSEPNCRMTLPFPRTLLVEFARSRFDLIHTQTPFGLGIWGAMLARWFNLPLVHTYHTFFEEYSHYLRLREQFGRAFVAQYSRIYCNRCQALVVPSAMFIEVLRSYHVTPPIHVIPTGVAVPSELPERDEARRRTGLPADRPILLYVGRLAREKSIDFLFQAVRALTEESARREDRTAGPPLLVLVGAGPHRDKLEEEARELGIAGQILWTGPVPHARVYDYYRASDLFVFASRTETQGLVVAEALSAGLPVVAVKGPGVSDFVSPSTGGFLTEPTIEAFLHPVRALLKDRDAWQEAADAGRAAAPLWSSRRQAETVVSLYDALLAEPRPPRTLRRALQTVSAGIGSRERLVRRRLMRLGR